jgi:hypothetical protein
MFTSNGDRPGRDIHQYTKDSIHPHKVLEI